MTDSELRAWCKNVIEAGQLAVATTDIARRLLELLPLPQSCSPMTDTGLRAWAETIIYRARPGSGCTIGAEIVAAARRLLELLPPADDGEAVTADWLESVGFVDDSDIDFVRSHHGPQAEALYAPSENGTMRFGVANMTGDEWWFYLLGGDGYDGSEDSVTPVRTRGRVRQVCEALGITLKEPK